MTVKNLLARATPEAVKYIKETVSSTNKVDYQKLKKLFDKQKFEARNFEDTELNSLTFDWQSLECDRNWWWQLQALPFLNWYVNSFALQTEHERARYFSCCLDAVYRWASHAKENKESPLVWHDHAAAFRVRNLSNWLLYCHTKSLPISDDDRIVPLAELITEHLDWLQKEEHYSKHTNHGFDQAMIALTIGLMFDVDEFELIRKRNCDRLKGEVAFAFTDQGVHKENSPGYQKVMLGRLKQLRTLVSLGEKEVPRMGERYIEKAETFLRAITLPNGYLPMIGDTQGQDKGLPYEQKDQIDVLDYSASGYVIVRGTVLAKDFHLIFKACHLSQYHRHDDDLSIHLYFNGKVLLGDGGLGSHNEKDEKRISLRSIFSHNAPYIDSQKAIRKISDLNWRLPNILFLGKRIIGESYCFGSWIKREIDISNLEDGKITLKDTVEEETNNRLASNFYSFEGLYKSNGQLFVPADSGRTLRIKPKGQGVIKEKLVHFSRIFGEFDKASAFSVMSSQVDRQSLEMEIELDYPKKNHA